jgi:hypothetical protein
MDESEKGKHPPAKKSFFFFFFLLTTNCRTSPACKGLKHFYAIFFITEIIYNTEIGRG